MGDSPKAASPAVPPGLGIVAPHRGCLIFSFFSAAHSNAAPAPCSSSRGAHSLLAGKFALPNRALYPVLAVHQLADCAITPPPHNRLFTAYPS